MSLLIFNYLLAAFFFIYGYYLDSVADSGKNSSTSSNTNTNMSVILALGFLLIGLSVHVCLYDNARLGAVCLRFGLLCFAYSSLLLFSEAFAEPYYSKIKAFSVLGVIFMLLAFAGFFYTVNSMELVEVEREGRGLKQAVQVNSREMIPGTGITGFFVLAAFYFVLMPLLSVLTLFFRSLAIRSRIYKQRLLFMSFALLVGFAISLALAYLSRSYLWAFSFIPLGFAFVHIAFNRLRDVTTIVDRSVFAIGSVNFICIWFLFSVIAAFGVVFAYNILSAHTVVLFLIFTVFFVLLIYARASVATLFSRVFRVGSDYAADLERALDGLAFSGERDEISRNLEEILAKYVDCSSFDILMSDDKGAMKTIYSSKGREVSFQYEGNKAIVFLLAQNETVVLKTQAVSKHLFADVKSELLPIFDLTGADAFLLLREGPRVVGMLMFGPKRRAADYSEYDYSTFLRLYSNFFLVMYYLKNIANEGVMVTVARELEFSGQVIVGIQENVDHIQNPRVDCNYITKSARKLGGDFIDFIRLSGDKYLFVMGDVSGKGLTASMSMVIMKSVLRTFLRETTDFKELVVKMNTFVRDNLPKGTFFAGVFGIFDFKRDTMFYLNCGIPTMFLYTAGYNNAIEIQGDGHVLGFVRDIAPYLHVKKIALNPGDVILTTTDGLINSANLRGERYGKSRVQKSLLDNRTYTADRMTRFLCEDVESFISNEADDDITVLVFKYLGSEES